MAENKDKNRLVVQSNQLIESRYSLTTGEQRLVLAMISLIRPDDREFKPYKLTVQDLAMYLNIDIRNAYREADKLTTRLMERVLHIPQEDGSLYKTHWVSDAHHEKGLVTLMFSPKLKPYLLKLKRQFTQLQLNTITQFQSIYTIRLYSFLKQYEKIGHREFLLSELRDMLGINPEEYPRFDNFKARVIMQAKKEFESKKKDGTHKSDITFEIETFRTGRKISRIRFNIKKQSFQDELPIQYEETESRTLQKLKYFGVEKKKAEKLFTTYGEAQCQAALDLYTDRLQKGKVIKKSGGYLIKLVEEGAGLKSQYEQELEAKERKKELAQIKRQKQLEAQKIEEDAVREERAQENRVAFDSLAASKKKDILKKFEKTISFSEHLKTTYVNEGIDAPEVIGVFNKFLEENL